MNKKKKTCIKVYVSGKMTGLTREQYEKNFKEAEEKVKKLFEKNYDEIIVFNPAFKTVNTCNGFKYEECMEMDFLLIKLSDIVYFMKNWLDSSVAKREFFTTKSLNKIAVFEDITFMHDSRVLKSLITQEV